MQRASGPQTLQFQIADDSCVFRSCLPSLVRHVAPSQQLQQVGLPHSLILSYSLFISPPLPCPYPSRTLPPIPSSLSILVTSFLLIYLFVYLYFCNFIFLFIYLFIIIVAFIFGFMCVCTQGHMRVRTHMDLIY